MTNLLFALPLWAAAVPPIENADFEQGAPGKPPAGWALREISARQGFTATVVDQGPGQGKGCLEIARREGVLFGQYAAVSQSLPATELRGKRVRFSALVRTSGLTGFATAGLFARVHRPDFRPGHCGEMNDKPERGKEWVRRAVIVDVADDAERLELGFVFTVVGSAWFDDAKLVVLGPAGVGNEPPAPLSERGRRNVEAFAKLLAYVRFFHPSDEAAAADWDRFAVGHVAYVEAARSPEELAARLTELFAPAAPTMRVFVSGKPPDAVPELEEPKNGAFRVVAWRHMGSDPNHSLGDFRHHRVTDRDLAGAPVLKKSPEPLPKPADVYEADLGGGVSCRLPTSLYADSKGTIPKATAKPRPFAKSDDFPPSGDDRTTRLACVCMAWGFFQHFYPYFEETKADWPAALREALPKAAVDKDATAFNVTIRRLIARLQDSHGSVRPGNGAPRYDGALPFSWDVVEGKLAVTWVDPAAKLRVTIGDVVETIDGVPAMERVKAMEPLASGATPGHRRYRLCADLRIGPAGQPVALDFRKPTGEAYSLTVPRQSADDSPLRGPSMREPRWEKLSRPAPGVVYVDLDRFKDRELHMTLRDVGEADGVVFDLRGYPQVGTWILGFFAERGMVSDQYSEVITRLPDRRGVTLDTQKLPPSRPFPQRFDGKAAFLTDGRAVSYAETCLALVDNTKIGPIVGEPTAGSNGGVALYTLPDGTRVSWTGQKAVRANGSRLHGVGIQPTVPVRRTLKGLAEGRDEALEKAVELVRPGK
jgi:C-terminal processing protease CtpA/Prc